MPILTGSMSSASFWYTRWSLFLLLMTHEMGFCSRAQEDSEAVPIKADSADLVIVVGAGGEATYESLFSQWASVLAQVGEQAGAKVWSLGPEIHGELPGEGVKGQFAELVQQLNRETQKPLWVAFIGHGTYDGELARFNVKGPDISHLDLVSWFEPIQRPLALINTTSASAPFLKELSGPGRVILTATRDGFELNFARFGSYLVHALGSKEADLDKDGQTSLLEAFIMASRQTGEFYEIEGRLVSEHALLDDTGDQRGTPADWFRGVRPVKKAVQDAKPDGWRASQFHLVESELESRLSLEMKKERDALEQAVFELRDRRASIPMKEYLDQLEALLLPLARLYQSVDVETSSKAEPSAD